jgi:hypothetical protein
MRGTGMLASCANFKGEPRYVSISIGLLDWKSMYIVVGFSIGCVIFWIVVSRKSAGNVQSCARARERSSSITPLIIGRTPTLSKRSAWLGVSKNTLAGSKAMGLETVSCEQSILRAITHPIIRSYCCWRMLDDTLQSTCPELNVMARASAMSD